MNKKLIFADIIGGTLITLLTGLISNTPPMWAGSTLYGYPLAWLIHLVLAPQYFPWKLNIANMIGDIIIWTIIMGIILLIWIRIKK